MKGIKPSGLKYNLTGVSPVNIPGKEGPGITQENLPDRRRIDDYLGNIQGLLGKGQNLGDIYTDPKIAGLYLEVQKGRAGQMNQENKILEHQRLGQLEERSLVFPESCGGLSLLDYKVSPYVDSSGNLVYYNDPETGASEPLVICRGYYGYRFYDKKPEYNKNIYEEILRIANRASDLGLNVGSVERKLINANIINDSFEIRGYSHYRINGSDDYESSRADLSYQKGKTIPEKLLNALYNLVKGEIVGPRIIIYSKKPIRPSQLELLLKAISDEDSNKKVEEMENI